MDFFSFIIVPLLSVIEGRVSLSPWQGTLLVAIGSIASGIIQPIVALLSDRHDTRWFGTLGFGALVLAIGSVGYADSFGVLVAIQIIGAAGSGAFHPVAAAAVGQLSGTRRSGGLAWFYAAGMVGGVLGNLISPAWVRHFSSVHPAGTEAASLDLAAGLRSLAWFIGPGLLAAIVLAAAIHAVPHRHATAHTDHAMLSRAERVSRWRSVWLLYIGNILRFTVDMCLITLIVRWSEVLAVGTAEAKSVGADIGAMLTPQLRSTASELNGLLQAARQAGMGIGGLAVIFLLRGRGERMQLVLVPLAGAVCIAITPWASHLGFWMAMLLCAAAGVGYGGVMPTTLSLAQRLLPHRTGLASALMLGGAWAFASAGPQLAQLLFGSMGLAGAMLVIALLLAASGVLGLMLTPPGRA